VSTVADASRPSPSLSATVLWITSVGTLR